MYYITFLISGVLSEKAASRVINTGVDGGRHAMLKRFLMCTPDWTPAVKFTEPGET